MRAILLCAYGSPSGPADVERYYTRILGGRKPPEGMLTELTKRYEAIGGISPLKEITERQAAALQKRMKAAGMPDSVRVGMKYSPPFIEDAVRDVCDEGFDELLVLPLTPFNSTVGADSYAHIAEEAAGQHAGGIDLRIAGEWNRNAHLVACWNQLMEAETVRERFDHVMFTAHSIPEKFIESGEPYRRQIEELAAALSAARRLQSWELAFQSAPRSNEKWIGPSVEERLQTLSGSTKKLLIVPIGFVSEHLEVLYDIDITFRQQAEALGIELRRTGLPNDSDEFIRALEELCAL